MSLLDMFSRYDKTNYKAGFLLEDSHLLARSEIHVRAPEFVAPRKLDFRDMCVRSSNQGNTPHCFPGYTRILMEDLSWMEIMDIRPGMRVISSDGKPHAVIQIMKRPWQGTMRSIKATGFSEPIISTQEHPYMVIKRSKKRAKNSIDDRKIEWIEAKDIKVGDYVATIGTNLRSIDCEPIYGFESDPEFMWAVGLYLAEGILWEDNNKGKRCQIGFCLNLKESQYADRLTALSNRYGFKIRIEKRPKTHVQVVVINSLPWRRWIDTNCGRWSNAKKLSSRIMLMPPSVLKNILLGWLDGDGYEEIEDRHVGTTVSKEMVYQMKLIGNKCGFTSMLKKWKKRENRQDTWSLTLQIKEHGMNSRGFLHNGLYFTPVIETKTIPQYYGTSVYNLEVDKTHDYIVDFAVVHNCCGFGTAGFIEIQNWRINHFPEQVNGHAIYYEAKKIDGYPGDGTFVRYGVQAALTMGLTEGIGKHIGRDRMDLKFAIHQYYACIGALRITDEWNLVEKRTGIISNFGSNAKQIGGHCVLVVGYDDYGVYIQNSWSEDWALFGFALLSWEQWDRQWMEGMVIEPKE
jgi:hypothetical protein